MPVSDLNLNANFICENSSPVIMSSSSLLFLSINLSRIKNRCLKDFVTKTAEQNNDIG